MAVLPPEIIITGVLSRLPVKSLLRFRCVSKHWCAEIDNPYFINLHLNLSTATKSNFSLISACHWYPDILFSIKSDSEVAEIKFPFINCEDRIHVWGSCNGLLLLEDSRYKKCFFLFNPSTRKHFVLPDMPKQTKYSNYEHNFFVYDDMNNDYKVFSILLQTSSDRTYTWISTEARVYSVKSNSWLIIKNFEHSVMNCVLFAYVNVALHSIIETKDPVNSTNIVVREIIATDIESGARHVMLMPESMGKKDYCFMTDTLVGGCLCVLSESIRSGNTHSNDIWVMKEYGVRESWSMLLSVVFPESCLFPGDLILYSKSHNEVLLHHYDDHGGQFVWRNLETGTTRNFLSRGFPFALRELYICVESLVSVHIL